MCSRSEGNTRCKLCIEICVTHRKCLSRLPLLLSSIILPHTASFISSDTPTRKKESSLLRLYLRTLKFLTSISEHSTYPLVAFIDIGGGAFLRSPLSIVLSFLNNHPLTQPSTWSGSCLLSFCGPCPPDLPWHPAGRKSCGSWSACVWVVIVSGTISTSITRYVVLDHMLDQIHIDVHSLSCRSRV